MSAYLYTWNPKRWIWVDQADAVYRVSNGEQYGTYWSCGNTKRIQVGDIFFLMRLGEDPKGLIGCGYISSVPYLLPHWDAVKAAEGKEAIRTDLLFKALSDIPIISLADLQRRYPAYKWTPEAGGVTVPEPIAGELFQEIQQSLTFGFVPESLADVQRYAEGKAKTVTSKTYDRSPQARQACIEHYGYNCSVCGFNFKSAYGELGATYIEVHHLRQVADAGEEYLIDAVRDLRPVCANCHRMLHRRRPPLSIEELRSERRRKLMESIWIQLRDLFEHDDGSLPEIKLTNLNRKAIPKVFATLWRRGHDVTAGGASYCDRRDGQDKTITSAEEAATAAVLVCSRDAEAVHVVIGGLGCAGSQIPDLGVFVHPEGLVLDYRMGPAWGPKQVATLFELFLTIAEAEPDLTVQHQFSVEAFDVAWRRYREARDTI